MQGHEAAALCCVLHRWVGVAHVPRLALELLRHHLVIVILQTGNSRVRRHEGVRHELLRLLLGHCDVPGAILQELILHGT